MNLIDDSFGSKPRRMENRRRTSYELAKQRDLGPLAIFAGMAAAVMHTVIFMWGPEVLQVDFRQLFDPPERVKDDVVRVVVKQKVEEEMEVAKQEELPPEEPQEIEEIPYEPVEIDILDVEVEELQMAPGKTEIAMPEPVYMEQEAPSVADMAPAQLDVSAFQTESMPQEALAVPEPTPVNSNDVVVMAEAQDESLENASDLMEREMRKTAAQDGGELPADTRSLADLLGESNLGASSGVARLGADVLFGFNECQLKNSARITMLQLAALIQKNPETDFVIEGHTDSLGTNAYNALLGLRRAAAVRSWLAGNDVPLEHVYIRSCGCTAPLVDTKLGMSKQGLNRRVEIHMRKKGEKLPDGCKDHKYKVDMETPIRSLLSAGVRVEIGESLNTDKQNPAEQQKKP